MTSPTICLLNAKYWLQTMGRAGTPRVFVNSIPKSGTNLIVSLTKAYGQLRLSGPVIAPQAGAQVLAKRKGLVFGHVEQVTDTLDSMGFDAGFLLVRRPEAYVKSLARYIDVNKGHPAHGVLGGTGSDALCSAVIEGAQAGPFKLEPVHDRYARYIDSAQQAGFQIADFDRLLANPPNCSPEAALLGYIGGPDFAAHFEAALARSQETSTTYRHSQNARTKIALNDAMFAHPNMQEAQACYDRALCR